MRYFARTSKKHGAMELENLLSLQASNIFLAISELRFSWHLCVGLECKTFKTRHDKSTQPGWPQITLITHQAILFLKRNDL
jgi:hypothetical protein